MKNKILELILKNHSKHIHILKNGNYYHFNPLTGLNLEFNEEMLNDKNILEYFKIANSQLIIYDRFKKDLERENAKN